MLNVLDGVLHSARVRKHVYVCILCMYVCIVCMYRIVGCTFVNSSMFSGASPNASPTFCAIRTHVRLSIICCTTEPGYCTVNDSE